MKIIPPDISQRLLVASGLASKVLSTCLLFIIAACTLTPPLKVGEAEAKQRFGTLKANNRLSSMANLEFEDAYAAILAVERADGHDQQQFQHLLWIAEHKIDLADIVSKTKYLEYQRTSLLELLYDLQRKSPILPHPSDNDVINHHIDR